jgi:site-specific recombinase XerD
VRLGDLRHLTVTSMLDAGIAPQVVAEILGNDPETLMANYAHIMTGRKQAAVEAMGRLAARRRAS